MRPQKWAANSALGHITLATEALTDCFIVCACAATSAKGAKEVISCARFASCVPRARVPRSGLKQDGSVAIAQLPAPFNGTRRLFNPTRLSNQLIKG